VVSTLRFLATYQTPEDAFNTASLVKKKSTSELKRILKRNYLSQFHENQTRRHSVNC
jgi:hypothetical protein